MKMNIDIFRKNLAVVRTARGFTQRELSAKAGLKQLKRIENIERFGSPTLPEVYAICNTLGVSIDNMLTKTVVVTFDWEELPPQT